MKDKRGRPTSDPKTTTIVARVPARHARALARRVRREGVTTGEALRRCLDEWLELESAVWCASVRERRR
jgi:hypothetical protein